MIYIKWNIRKSHWRCIDRKSPIYRILFEGVLWVHEHTIQLLKAKFIQRKKTPSNKKEILPYFFFLQNAVEFNAKNSFSIEHFTTKSDIFTHFFCVVCIFWSLYSDAVKFGENCCICACDNQEFMVLVVFEIQPTAFFICNFDFIALFSFLF